MAVAPHLLRREKHQLAQLALALPGGPVLLVQLHEPPRRLERALSRVRREHRVAAQHLLALGERAVGHGQLPLGDTDAGAGRAAREPSGLDQGPVLERLLDELLHRIEEPLRRRTLGLGGLDDGKEAHGNLLAWVSGAPWSPRIRLAHKQRTGRAPIDIGQSCRARPAGRRCGVSLSRQMSTWRSSVTSKRRSSISLMLAVPDAG